MIYYCFIFWMLVLPTVKNRNHEYAQMVIIRDRVGISKTELVSMLEEEELKDAVLVVLANKQVIYIEIMHHTIYRF